mgnify:CR=1 FL=1
MILLYSNILNINYYQIKEMLHFIIIWYVSNIFTLVLGATIGFFVKSLLRYIICIFLFLPLTSGLKPVNLLKYRLLNIYEDKAKILKRGNVFTDRLIESFKRSVLMHWATELKDRIIPNNMALVRDCKKLHGSSSVTDLDVVNWEKINHLRYYLMKDSLTEKSLFTRVREAIENKDYELASNLQKEMNEKIQLLKTLYIEYKRNLIDLD